jgi:hypothetical protein
MAAQLLRDARPDTPSVADADARWLCASCDGFVCGHCGEQPAPATGAPCRVCEPLTLLTREATTALIDAGAAELGRRHKVPVRAVHGRLKTVMKVPSRAHASLEQLASALNAVEQWLAEPADGRFALPDPTEHDLAGLDDPALRAMINTLVGPVASRVRQPVPLFQASLNRAIGLPRGRATATENQLRDAVRLLRRWLEHPSTYPSRPAPTDIERVIVNPRAPDHPASADIAQPADPMSSPSGPTGDIRSGT